jgi:hypothetical protein
MKLVPIVLLVANLLVAASFFIGREGASSTRDRAQAEIHPESIRIVGVEREPGTVSNAATVEEAPVQSLVCATWGMFSESQAAAAEARLAPLELGARLSRTATSATTNYLVIIPPIPARADLNTRVDELKRLGVNDQFVINDGELRNGISLGFFKSEEAANRHLAALRAKGVGDALVKPKPSGNLVVTLQAKDLTGAERAKLEAIASELSGAELKVQPCPNGASG